MYKSLDPFEKTLLVALEMRMRRVLERYRKQNANEGRPRQARIAGGDGARETLWAVYEGEAIIDVVGDALGEHTALNSPVGV